MNFQFRTGNFAQAGNAAARDFEKTLDAARTYSVRHDDIVKDAATLRSREKIAAIQIESEVRKRGIEAQSRVKREELVQSGKANYRQAKRKAGVLAAGGQMVGEGARLLGEEPRTKREVGEGAEGYTSLIERNKTQAQKLREQAEGVDLTGGFKPMEFTPLEVPDTSGGDSSGSTGGGSGSTGSGSGSGSVPKGIKGEMFTYLTKDKGLSRNHALGLMANIQRESNFNPSIASGDDGGYGGLFQWKGSRQTSTVAELVKSGDWKGQIDYALTEPESLSAVKPGSYQATNFQSPQEAADWWMTKWERPADTASGSKKHSQFISTYNF